MSSRFICWLVLALCAAVGSDCRSEAPQSLPISTYCVSADQCAALCRRFVEGDKGAGGFHPPRGLRTRAARDVQASAVNAVDAARRRSDNVYSEVAPIISAPRWPTRCRASIRPTCSPAKSTSSIRPRSRSSTISPPAPSAACRSVLGLADAVGDRQRRGPRRTWLPDADRSEDRQAGHAGQGRRRLQYVFHAGRPLGDRRRRGACKRLDFRDPHTMALQLCCNVRNARASTTPILRSTAPMRSSPANSTGLVKIDMATRKSSATWSFAGPHAAGHPHFARRQGLFRRRHDGRRRVRRSTATTFKEIGFIPTGVGTHGLYPSRDGTKLYVSNRGTHIARPPARRGQHLGDRLRHAQGRANWPIPDGGSPDMGNVSADGRRCGCRAATTTWSMRSTRPTAR